MKSNHTPGPWIVTNRDEEGHYDIESMDRGTLICSGAGFYGLHDPSEPNAKLISAAPDLLEACIKLENALHHTGPCHCCSGSSEEPGHDESCPVLKARVAISKAIGE